MNPGRLIPAGIVLAAGILFAAFDQSPSADKTLEAARLNNLGAAYMNQQLFEKALKSFQDAAALDPRLEIAKLNQGVALLNLARVDQAKPILEQAVKQSPADPYVWFSLGLLYKNTGNTESAIDAFRHVTQLDPNDADSWYFLGAVYAQNKQYAEAVDAFQHALKLNPLHASAEFGLSRAYQQSGDLAHAREHLVRFQYVTQNKLGSPISLAYGEQGKYSLAEESPAAPPKVPPQIKVRFVDVTREAGLVTEAISKSNDLASFLGPGACFLDYDGDGKIDIFVADDGPLGGMTLYRNTGDSRFEDVTHKAGMDGSIHGTSCTAGDYDNDGATDLAVSDGDRVLLLHNEKNGTFKDMADAAGIRYEHTSNRIEGLTFIDYDHDGDLDLYATESGLSNQPSKPTKEPIVVAAFRGHSVMWRNNGNGTFTDVSEETGLGVLALNAIGTDFNNDRAVDMVVTGGSSAAPLFLKNPREGKFQSSWGESGSRGDAPMGVAVLDYDHDGWMDFAFTHSKAALTLVHNDHDPPLGSISYLVGPSGDQTNSVRELNINWARAYGVAAFDYDNDGWVDLVAVGETADGKGEVRLFRNLGPDGFKDVTADVGLDKIDLKNPRAVITGDYDNDGATDLLITQNQGPAVLLRNEGGNQNHWLRLNLKGLADNKSAIGTKVEIFSGGVRQKFEIAGSSGYLGQNSPYLTVGLGQATQADVVRMTWPTGVLQDEIEVAGDHEQKFTEIDRRGSSCPTLFVWDGRRYKLVADMIGAGVVGHWVGPGQRNVPRPVEYVKLDRDTIREKDGKLSFRFMEPLEEAVYLDQVELLAVDHPRDLDVYPNEYFASNPPYPPFKLVFSQDARPPAGAWDEHGHDLLPDLQAHRYVGDFEVLPFAGFTKPHTLELDLGKPYDGGPLWLLMHGEIEYFSATGMYAADQAGLQPTAPSLEALDAKGKWVHILDDMGFPAGGPRTMTADLSGKLPPGARRIRITTNLQIYWDNILISRTPQNQSARVTSIPLASADLRFHGFPLKIEGQPPGNIQYVYEKASPTGPYTRPAGAYTRYGDVLPLLTGLDDRLAVFGSGDEVALDFDPSKIPAPPAGWVRDYFYVARGYEKDMDFYAYDFDRVTPLPFRGMGGYPYPGKSFPLDDFHLNYLLEYNTRYMSGHEARGFAFDYDPPK